MASPEHATIEQVRAYWNRRPCNIRHSSSPIGTARYFEEVEARKYMVEPHIPLFSEFERWRGKQVLEVGCGIGTAAVSFARAGAFYTAIELSQESLDLAKRRFQLLGLKGSFHLGNAEELSKIVPPGAYDLIYSFGVIHHSPHPEKIVAEIEKFMDQNSEFRLMLYAANSWKGIMVEAGLDQPEAQSGCPIALTYTHAEIAKLLAHYDILELRQDHIFPYIVEKYIRYEYELQPWFQAMPPGMLRALEKSLGWHSLVRCRLKNPGAGLPAAP